MEGYQSWIKSALSQQHSRNDNHCPVLWHLAVFTVKLAVFGNAAVVSAKVAVAAHESNDQNLWMSLGEAA
ncbi:Uncharacterised protein [Mycobacteroides abscessus subsp. abscessus]|nr:Uncharacterised protein [Mycobacteroides abscessus subsp. abscessus]